MTTEAIEKQDECSLCLYKGEVKLPSVDIPVTVCRKYPPTLMKLGNGILSIYPSIMNDGWCGEFKKGVGPKIKTVESTDDHETTYSQNIIKMFPVR